MANEARKSQREAGANADASTPRPSPPRAKALPRKEPTHASAPRSPSIPGSLLDELLAREYWAERAQQEAERLADADPAGPSPKSVRPSEADSSFDVGEDPWGLAR